MAERHRPFLLDQGGRPLRAVGISQDVTERRRLEAQFQQAQKMEAEGRLAGGVAHDFNNLLTVILGFSEMLREGAGADHRRRVEITEIYKAGARASELTRQLWPSAASKSSSRCCSTSTSSSPTCGRCSPASSGKTSASSCTSGRELALIKADRSQLEQIVL